MTYHLTADPAVRAHRLESSEAFPDNPALPLLIYQGVLELDEADPASVFEAIFSANDWGGMWRDGVFHFQHYHSNAHEALGVAAGQGRVQFGGPEGPTLALAAGDLAILPAGTVHKNAGTSPEFEVVGAYPAGQEDYDMMRGEPGEGEGAKERIAATPLPTTDPLYGQDGPLLRYWGGG